MLLQKLQKNVFFASLALLVLKLLANEETSLILGGQTNSLICRRRCDQTNYNILACSCDPKCHYFGECCADRHQAEMFPWPGTCVTLRLGEWADDVRVNIVTKCMKNDDFVVNMSQLCENVTRNHLVSLIPIYDASQNLSFRNIYCAMCNHVKQEDLMVWPFQIDAQCAKKELLKVEMEIKLKQLETLHLIERRKVNQSAIKVTPSWRLSEEQEKLLLNEAVIQTIVKEGKCELAFPFDEVYYCDERQIISTCPERNSNSTLHSLCVTGAQSIVASDEHYYRNSWCAMCNNWISNFNSCTTGKPNTKDFPKYLSLSSLIDFTSIVSNVAKPFYDKVCNFSNKSTTNLSQRTDHTVKKITHANRMALILSLTSTSLSMLAVIFFAVLLFIYSELQKRNCITLFILAIFIFLTNMVYIIMALQNYLFYSKWFCITIGVANHLFNMQVCLWSFFIAVDICVMLHQSNSTRSSYLSMKKMCAITFGTSVLMTSAALGADRLAPQWIFSPRFGETTCWINSVGGHLLFFYAPTLLIMLTNCGVFFFSVYFLVNAAYESSELRRNEQQMASYKIIIKIALITGLPNIVGFTIVLVSNDSYLKDVLNAIYSLIYGLQGMLLVMSIFSSQNVQIVMKKSVNKCMTENMFDSKSTSNCNK